MACDIVTGLGPVADITTDAGFAQQNRLSAANALAVAASTIDPQYQRLTDLLKKAVNAIQETFDAGNATTVQALREAKDYCDGR